MRMMNSRSGKAYVTSVSRIITLSVKRPPKAAVAPTSRPMINTTICVPIPIWSEMLTPAHTRAQLSRPRLSVPKKWLQLGPS